MARDKKKEIFQLKITLEGTNPPIWRRVLVERTTTFKELHDVIQILMNWHGSHLSEFVVNDLIITPHIHEDNDFAYYEEDEGNAIDAKKITLDDVITRPKTEFEYIYDFGDYWVHIIEVEKFLDRDPSINYPVCIGGALNSPPEDCGGFWGYYNLLEILRDENHPEHEEYMELYGDWWEMFGEKYFDIDEINNKLERLRK